MSVWVVTAYGLVHTALQPRSTSYKDVIIIGFEFSTAL